ncbi:hypothetical protein SPKIRA_08060 [Sphingomonas paucimobilis]|uniref:Lar family restriction alleviation protein n=1 Tax=Sphingomonas paucimobilis TaxID=13689 RepID=UPI0015DD3C16|nr:Lar family restriction alleviation protein [Sphingomonas paucimobilis]BCI69976.1 hypothetical protein SPKIRA_08060 [Sphingomonas paucimobilis]
MADIPESTQMLPCPFCEGPGHLQHSTFEIDAGWHVVCHGQKDCPLYCSEPYQVHGDEADAVNRWNTRAAPPAMDREAVERVREAAYRQALEDVCNPLGYLQRMADAEGAKLSGMAYAIASDIGTIQRIAKEALSTLSADAIRQGEGWQPISDADTSQERLTVLGYGTFRGRSHPQVVVLDWVKWIGSWSAYTMPFEPTHWMPLPATPASHASDGGKA